MARRSRRVLTRALSALITPLLLASALLGAGACGSESAVKPEPSSSIAKPGVSASAAPLELKELDTASLTPRERRELFAQLAELPSPCSDTPVPISTCIAEKKACKACLPAAELVSRLVRAGKSKEERASAYSGRFDAKAIKTIDIGDAPFVGPENAPITIVEWADFECPFCMMVSPLLDTLIERFPGQVRLVFKVYPLAGHKNGEIAARAAVAALNQGKFWEMHHKLFENQGKNDKRGLEGLARDLELDMKKFKEDFASDETLARIERDKKQADELGLDGTPLIYIGGRKVELEQLISPYEDLESWVKLDLEMAGKTPNPPSDKWKAMSGGAPAVVASSSAEPASSAAPSATPSAAPSAAPSASTKPK